MLRWIVLLFYFRLWIGINNFLLNEQEGRTGLSSQQNKNGRRPIFTSTARTSEFNKELIIWRSHQAWICRFRDQKKYSAYESFLGNVSHCQIWTKKKTMTTLRLSYNNFFCHCYTSIEIDPKRFTFVHIKMARKVTLSNLNVCCKFAVCLLYLVFHSPWN